MLKIVKELDNLYAYLFADTWSGAKQRTNLLYENNKLDEFAEWLEEFIEVHYCDNEPLTETELNDLIWFDEEVNEKIDELLEE